MDDYLKGFIEGYQKANEADENMSFCGGGTARSKVKKPTTSGVCTTRTTKSLYQEIKKIEDREKRLKSNY